MKKKIFKCTVATLIACFLFTGCGLNNQRNQIGYSSNATSNIHKQKKSETQKVYKDDKTTYAFRTEGKEYQLFDGDNFNKVYFEGVNIGAGAPNEFPGEYGITEEQYMEWLQKISDMNANTIRVYTVLSPAFYDAFYEFNESSEHKLYLFQGVWFDEYKLAKTSDAYDTMELVKNDLKNLVNIIHGNATVNANPGHASGIYTHDISKYVAGWLLGIEPDVKMVKTTNKNHPDKKSFNGNYLKCKNVQPFETLWCEIGDYAVSYEDENYKMQRPVGFVNWPTTDVLSHPNEPMYKEDEVGLNEEDIKKTDRYKAGMFVSYHVYPYYPSFLFCSDKYASYKDKKGKKNPYKAYIDDLVKLHKLPVIISEFGIPSSRGITHVNPVSHYNQGNVTEEQQGNMLVSMFKDIKDEGCAGAMVFTWQDEWFKRTWNTTDQTNPERRPYWDDVQTCEQHFGLLEFVPGAVDVNCKIDGNTDDWNDKDILLADTDGNQYYVKKDESYLYIMIKSKTFNFNNGKSSVYFDITPKSGSKKYKKTKLDSAADFVLNFRGEDNTRLYVQNYYDQYSYQYNKFDKSVNLSDIKKNSTKFNRVYLMLDRSLYLPKTKKYIPARKAETGKMKYGISDVNSKEYNSLSDFYIKGDVMEVRIPWGLLQFRDPSTKEIADDFWTNKKMSGININSIQIGSIVNSVNKGEKEYTWDNWEQANYHERLKKSYYIIQKYLGEEKK